MDGDQTLAYLDHARERMAQRGITPQEVEEVLGDGSTVMKGKVPGKIKVLATTAAGRRIEVTRFQDKAVVISAVCLDKPKI